MKFFLFAFIFSWLPALSFAAGGDECINSKPGDEKEFCIAKTRINSGNCEKISNGGLRSECLSYVKRSQRVAVWAIQPMDKNSIDIRTDSMKKYIWERQLFTKKISISLEPRWSIFFIVRRLLLLYENRQRASQIIFLIVETALEFEAHR